MVRDCEFLYTVLQPRGLQHRGQAQQTPNLMATSDPVFLQMQFRGAFDNVTHRRPAKLLHSIALALALPPKHVLSDTTRNRYCKLALQRILLMALRTFPRD